MELAGPTKTMKFHSMIETGICLLGVALGSAILLGGCASSRDSWVGRDKLLHLGTAAAISGTTTYAALRTDSARGEAAAAGVGVVLMVGGAKEAVDSREPDNFWSWKDMAWNLAGGLLGAAVAQVATEPRD